jgi:putative restriction endonuclease
MSLSGSIAPTDHGWYQFLSQRPTWGEVNFWTPSTHFAYRAEELSPFLFKLKAPHNAICGFGYFARYAPLPDWMAWDCFREGNGYASLESMRRKIDEIRRRMRFAGSARSADIGCIVLVNVSFFAGDKLVLQPQDWPPRNLRPMKYDLENGEGARVWNECLERTATRLRGSEATEGLEIQARYGRPVPIRPRLGQGAFRVAVTDAYARACAVTGEHSLPALDAAHIRPFAKDGPHTVSNGLLLRADVHRLFEQGYLGVTGDYRLMVSDRLRADYNNGRSYYPLHGKRLALPARTEDRPDPGLLSWHRDECFLSPS